MDVDYVPEQNNTGSQSFNSKVPKVQNDTLKCTLEEMAVIKLILENPMIAQKELVSATGKSISTIKRIMSSLQGKGYIRRPAAGWKYHQQLFVGTYFSKSA